MGPEVPATRKAVSLEPDGEHENMPSTGGEAEPASADTELDALRRDRDRWRLRALDAERRYREREPALRHLRSEIDALRGDRDQWRAQAQRLAARIPGPQAVRSSPGRTATRRAAEAAWRFVPEPGKRLARPAIRRLQAGRSPPAQPDEPPAEHPGEPAATGDDDDPAGKTSPVTETVSVIIPTLNAGPAFARTLDAIQAQEEVGGIEIVVVDSGSSDETVGLARAAGAKVVQIPPDQFSHGATRDRMAEMSSGEILLLTVQDAVMAGRHVIRDLVRSLRADPALAAVSGRQVPSADSDLFGAFMALDYQYQVASRRDDQESTWVQTLTAAERRALCSVDNVCAAIRRSAWEVLRFRDVDFAEDLDFGLRAVEQGWKTQTCPSAVVVHSHNRDAGYHLRRFVIDRLCLASQLGQADFKPVAAAGLDAVATGARALLGEIESAQADGDHVGVGLASFLAKVESMLATARPSVPLEGDLAIIDRLLDGGSNVSADPFVVEDRKSVV